jgi:hypothetical protein
VRDRIIASRSCNGLSVAGVPDWDIFEDGKFISEANKSR